MHIAVAWPRTAWPSCFRLVRSSMPRTPSRRIRAGRRQVARSQNRQSVFASLAGAALPSMNNFTSALRDLSARWNVHIHGAGAVKSILDRSWCVRVGLLLPAFHPWIALLRLSIVTSYKVRVSLIFENLHIGRHERLVLFEQLPARGLGSEMLDAEGLLPEACDEHHCGFPCCLPGRLRCLHPLSPPSSQAR